jgi:pyruvate-ferredoxin/flavodoxin oxidoreductase
LTSFAASSLRLLRRLLHAPAAPAPPPGGPRTILDGLSAVAATEARLSDTAALGATYPAASGGRAWSGQAEAQGLNELGEALSGIESESPRGALASAIGASMSGQRATVFLSGPDLLAGTDLLTLAGGQHVPLVVHLAARAVTSTSRKRWTWRSSRDGPPSGRSSRPWSPWTPSRRRSPSRTFAFPTGS